MALKADEVAALLQAGVTLSIDTNVAGSTKLMTELSVLIRRLNERQPVDVPALPVTIVVSAPAFAEVLLDHHQHRKGAFDMRLIDGFLQSTGIRVEGFLDPDARHFAQRVFEAVGDDTRWQHAKVVHAFAELKLKDRIAELLNRNARCSATVDWLIASQADKRNWLLVTDDTGWEFHGLARLTTWTTLMAALDRIG